MHKKELNKNFQFLKLQEKSAHYENMPMQYTEILKVVKDENFQKFLDIFLIFAQSIDCGYMFRGGSNQYPQSMFLIKVKKYRYTPAYPSYTSRV